MISGLLGIAFGLAAALFLLVGLIPLLGWLNWITSLPLAFIGLAFSRVSAKRKYGSVLGTIGTIICTGVIAVAILRLLLGHGII